MNLSGTLLVASDRIGNRGEERSVVAIGPLEAIPFYNTEAYVTVVLNKPQGLLTLGEALFSTQQSAGWMTALPESLWSDEVLSHTPVYQAAPNWYYNDLLANYYGEQAQTFSGRDRLVKLAELQKPFHCLQDITEVLGGPGFQMGPSSPYALMKSDPSLIHAIQYCVPYTYKITTAPFLLDRDDLELDAFSGRYHIIPPHRDLVLPRDGADGDVLWERAMNLVPRRERGRGRGYFGPRCNLDSVSFH